MSNAFWQLALFVRGQSFSVKTFDRSRNGCQVIREGVRNDFGGLLCRRFLSPRVSPSRAPVFSCAHYFQAPAMQANKRSKIDLVVINLLILIDFALDNLWISLGEN